MFELIRRWLGLATPASTTAPQDEAAAQALADAGLLVPPEPRATTPQKPARRGAYDREEPPRKPPPARA